MKNIICHRVDRSKGDYTQVHNYIITTELSSHSRSLMLFVLSLHPDFQFTGKNVREYLRKQLKDIDQKGKLKTIGEKKFDAVLAELRSHKLLRVHQASKKSGREFTSKVDYHFFEHPDLYIENIEEVPESTVKPVSQGVRHCGGHHDSVRHSDTPLNINTNINKTNTNNLIGSVSREEKKGNIFARLEKHNIRIGFSMLVKLEKKHGIPTHELEKEMEKWDIALSDPKIREQMTAPPDKLFFKYFPELPPFIQNIHQEKQEKKKQQEKQEAIRSLKEITSTLGIQCSDRYAEGEIVNLLLNIAYTSKTEPDGNSMKRYKQLLAVAKEKCLVDSIFSIYKNFDETKFPKQLRFMKEIGSLKKQVDKERVYSLLYDNSYLKELL